MDPMPSLMSTLSNGTCTPMNPDLPRPVDGKRKSDSCVYLPVVSLSGQNAVN